VNEIGRRLREVMRSSGIPTNVEPRAGERPRLKNALVLTVAPIRRVPAILRVLAMAPPFINGAWVRGVPPLAGQDGDVKGWPSAGALAVRLASDLGTVASGCDGKVRACVEPCRPKQSEIGQPGRSARARREIAL
jgi:hypothetical protein